MAHDMLGTGHSVTRSDIVFDSHGDQCAAWLYLPDGASKPPVVILGHGLGATRDMRMDAYAERFAAAGIAALAFTYRHFGDSTGEPRQLLSIKRQHQDWEAAIAYLHTRSDVDDTRMALWGASFGGGHAIAVASKHPELRAVVVQCPFTDGLASALELGIAGTLRMTPAILKDLFAATFRTAPEYIYIAGAAGDNALVATPDALSGFQSLVPAGGTWINKAAARVAPTVSLYRPGKSVSTLRMPILFCIGDRDVVTPPAGIEAYARTALNGEVKHYDSGHFDIYLGSLFESAVSDQIDFFTRTL